MSSTVRCILILVTTAVAAPPRAASAADRWNKVASPHFEVVGDVPASRLTTVLDGLEQFRLASERLFPKRRATPARPTTVVVFNGLDIRPYLPRYRGRIRETVVGYFRQGRDRNFLVMRADAFGSEQMRLVLHEYQHLITGQNVPDAPPWLGEGLAELYSTFVVNEKGRSYEIGYPIHEHLRTLNTNGRMPLEELFAVTRGSRAYNEATKVGRFYAQSWAFVHFCTFGEQGKLREPFGRLIEAIASGEPSRDAFLREFGSDVTGFERRLREYTQRSSLPAIRITFTRAAEAQAKYEAAQLPEDETEYLKARLAADQSHFDKSLKRALEANPNHVGARFLRGDSWLRSGMWEEAAGALSEAARGDSTDAHVCGAAAHALNLLRRHEDVLGICRDLPSGGRLELAFERSVALDALSRRAEARAHYGLAMATRESAEEMFDRIWRYLGAGLPAAAVGAVAVLQAHTDLEPEVDIYAQFARFVGFALLGRVADGRKDLTAAPLDPQVPPWPAAIYRYFAGELSAEALLQLAADEGQRTEAHAYVGMLLAAACQRDAARPHLEWVVQHGSRDFVEYVLTVTFMKRQFTPATPCSPPPS